jgi:diacylglycerol kinase (ATP)
LNRGKSRLLQRTIETLTGRGHRITAVATTGERTAAGIARQCIQEGADLILAAGGDGTINEVANGLVGSHVPLGVLPGGTANVLAVELGVGTNILHAAESVSDLVPVRIAAGLLESKHDSRYFLLMAGAGFDAMIVYNVNAGLKAKLGRVAYWIGGFSQLGKPLPQFAVRVNGSSSRCSFALASRVRNYGGDLRIARGASLLNDQFELVLFEGSTTLPYIRYLIGIIAGRPKMSGVSILQTSSAVLECPQDQGIYVQIDGEFAGRLPVKLSIVPDAITLLVPRAFRNTHRPTNG